ncbi:YchJ family protein [Spirochaeta cellobiosiphila]|uniref:YchJ family protein n=1 Tax=Spirochaeta cellobiosiphila TaxID=504483 RepID=UPI0004222727|nr:YchJ family protein [Spirochaeta cellobiosiphila]
MDKCPCGSGKDYSKCCSPYLTGEMLPPTAETLMRARYTAYVKHNIDFIEDTHGLDERDQLSVEETRKWAEESTWLGLQIVNVQKGSINDKEGVVEFIASYEQQGIKHDHHETSRFIKKEGKWYFKEGEVKPTTVIRTGVKVGRNDPCPCGSGKKYKKCCGM